MDEEYIPIQLPFSEDKELGGESDATTGIFPELTNYIVGNKVLKTREGIGEFGWSNPGYIPKDDPAALMHLRFEGANFKDCEIQGANFMLVTAGGTVCASATHVKEGSTSVYLEGRYAPGGGLWLGYYKKNNALPTGFPGQGGTGDCIISWWWYGTTFENNMALLKHDSESDVGGFSVRINLSGDYNPVLRTTNSSGSTGTIRNGAPIFSNQWYHFAMWSSQTLGEAGLVVYREDSDTEYTIDGGNKIGGTAANGANQLWVGLSRDLAINWTDDWICLNAVPATKSAILAKIRLMRARGL